MTTARNQGFNKEFEIAKQQINLCCGNVKNRDLNTKGPKGNEYIKRFSFVTNSNV